MIIVEDIIDSGLTLSWLRKNLASRGPSSIEIVALLRKPDAVKVDVDVRYVGFDIPTEFVVGYGLDYAERYRDLPFVGLLGRAHVPLRIPFAPPIDHAEPARAERSFPGAARTKRSFPANPHDLRGTPTRPAALNGWYRSGEPGRRPENPG